MEIKLTKDNLKQFMLAQSIEKTMRHINRDIRRFQPKVDKAIKNYNNHVNRLNEMKQTLKAFESKRDSILGSLNRETSILQ